MSRTAFLIEKDEAIAKILSALAPQGYRERKKRKKQFVQNLRGLLGRKTAWNPDVFLVNRGGEILLADVQLPEKEPNQYLPAAMEQAIPRISPSIGPLKIALFTPIGTVLDQSTIVKAAKLKVSVQVIDQVGNIATVLDPLTVCRSERANRNEKQIIQKQTASEWVIPQALVSKLPALQKLEYSRHLKRFAQTYFNNPSPISINAQYKIAAKCIEGILRYYHLDQCCEPLRISKTLQGMARTVGGIRDHFLHQFQTFLMGALILESYAGLSSSPFILCRSYKRMDLPWLLASIFHDYGFDLVNLESCLHTGIGSWRFQSYVNLQCSTLLNSFYDFLRNNGDLEDWNQDSYRFQSSSLEHILFDAGVERVTSRHSTVGPNHGVLSAHKIMNLGQPVWNGQSHLKPAFLSSALSASMHDKMLWHDMFLNSILPLDASRFSIVFLLILCDTLAEVGRPKTTVTRHSDTLVNFDITDNVIDYTVWFSEAERACLMNYWCSFVRERCFTNTFLDLNCRCLSDS